MTAPPLNYTTKVPVTRTVGECQQLLGSAGADAAAVMYEAREPVGLSFRLTGPHGRRDFSMPVNIAGVEQLLGKADYPGTVKASDRARYVSRKHAAAVAWRIIKDWLEAQLALVAAQMVSLDEVMLPYLEVEGGRTLYQAYQAREQAAALAGGRDG